MTEPKVSERMESLVAEYVMAVLLAASGGGGGDVGQARKALLSAIAEIEQRAQVLDDLAAIVRDHYADVTMPDPTDHVAATSHDWVLCAINELGVQIKRVEKWKRVALAAEAMTSFHNQNLANAIDSLGDEWDEAVKGEG